MKTAIKILAMDVDGTMTDGSLYISDKGEVYKKLNVKDGMGNKITQEKGIIVAIITGRKSTIVENRAKELAVGEIHQGITDKACCINELCKKYDCSLSEVAYIGDDINDISVIEMAGVSFAPSDAVPDVKKCCDIVLKSSGGNGAVRECVDYLIEYNDIQGGKQ